MIENPTAWQLHEAIKDAKRAIKRRHDTERAGRALYWNERPLCCRLGIHRPFEMIDTGRGWHKIECCHCGYQWNEWTDL